MIKTDQPFLTTARHAVTASLLIALSSGCMTVGPDYEEPVNKAPDAWSDAISDDFASDQPALKEWWSVFDDDVLTQLIQSASEGNLDLKAAASRIEEAHAQYAISRGDKLPDLDASGSASTARYSEAITPTLPTGYSREQGVYTLGVSTAWELDLWGRVRRSIEASGAAYDATIENYRDVLVVLYAEVASAYVDVRSLQTRIEFAEANVVAQKSTLELTQDRNAAGLVPDLDVRQAELNLATTQASIPSLYSLLNQMKNRLAVLSGETPGALNELLTQERSIPVAPSDVAIGLPTNLLRQRPDIRQAERQLASQTARVGVATGSLYPIFSLPGSLTLEALEPGDLLKGGNLSYGFGPAFSWNLFDGGRVRNAVRVEEYRTEQAYIAYESTVLRALEEVENNMVGVTTESDRQAFLGTAVHAAEESAKLVKTLYKSGLTDFQNVLDTERALASLHDQWAESRGLLSKNHIRLYKSLGGGWNLPIDVNEELITK